MTSMTNRHLIQAYSNCLRQCVCFCWDCFQKMSYKVFSIRRDQSVSALNSFSSSWLMCSFHPPDYMSSWYVFEILSQKEEYHFQISLVVTHQLQQFHLCFHLRISEKEDSFQMGKYSIPYLDPMGMNISQIFTNISNLSNIASINPIRGKSHTFRTRIPQKKQLCFGFLWFLWWNISQQWRSAAAFLSKEKRGQLSSVTLRWTTAITTLITIEWCNCLHWVGTNGINQFF